MAAGGSAIAALSFVWASPAFGQSQFVVSPPITLSAHANAEDESDTSPHLLTDGLGAWLAVWPSRDDLDGTIGDDWDILFSRSTDNGATWSAPAALNNNAASDSGDDWVWRSYGDHDFDHLQVVPGRPGTLLAMWQSNDDLGGTIGDDIDILFARSTDFGHTWSDPAPLYASAAFDNTDETQLTVTTDEQGHWVAIWRGGFVARSDDDGATWSDPVSLFPEHAGSVRAATDGRGNWVAVWKVYDEPSEYSISLFSASSADSGSTWSQPSFVVVAGNYVYGGFVSHRVNSDALGNFVAASRENGDSPVGSYSSAASTTTLLLRPAASDQVAQSEPAAV